MAAARSTTSSTDATVAPLAPRAVELCRFEGAQLCLPRLIDVRVLWVRADRVDDVPDTWDELARLRHRLRVPGPGVGPVRHLLRARRRRGGALFDAQLRPTMATPDAEQAIEMLCRLAARAPADLPDWHYDEVDAALLDGRVDAAAAWPGGWGAIRTSELADRLVPHLYPAGPARRVSYAGCHAWAIPRTCGDVDGARRAAPPTARRRARRRSTRRAGACARTAARSPRSSPQGDVDRRRLEITRQMIDDAMITYPPLVRFPEIEDAGWSAIRDALRGRHSPAAAARAIQSAAEQLLA